MHLEQYNGNKFLLIMFKNNVFTFRSFPVEEKERKWTDCCCTIIAALFALTLFILSFFIFSSRTPTLTQITTTESTSPSMTPAAPASTNRPMRPTSISSTSTTSPPRNTASRSARPPIPHSPAQQNTPVLESSALTTARLSSITWAGSVSPPISPPTTDYGAIISYPIK